MHVALAAAANASGEWSGGYGFYLLQTLLALIVVSAIAVLLLRLMRRRGQAPTRSLRVVARLDLEPRRSLYVVQVAGRLLLIGVGEGAMTCLAELDPAQAAELETHPLPGLWDLTKRAFGRGKDGA